MRQGAGTGGNMPNKPIPFHRTILHTLIDYRCQYTQDEYGDGLDLVDLLSPLDTIEEGKLELDLLADDIANALTKLLMGYLNAP